MPNKIAKLACRALCLAAVVAALSCHGAQDPGQTSDLPATTGPTHARAHRLWSLPICVGQDSRLLLDELGRIGIASAEVLAPPNEDYRRVSLKDVREAVNNTNRIILVKCSKVPVRMKPGGEAVIIDKVVYFMGPCEVTGSLVYVYSVTAGNTLKDLFNLYNGLDVLGPVLQRRERMGPKVIRWKSAHLTVRAYLRVAERDDYGRLDLEIFLREPGN